jgi:hypothetical protein
VSPLDDLASGVRHDTVDSRTKGVGGTRTITPHARLYGEYRAAAA